jgi:DNA-binding SARP family transcriptional activator
VRVNVLGPIEVTAGERLIRPAGQRQRALLAALALEQGRAVPVDRLVDAIWDVHPPATARAKVQTHVSVLRQAIGQDAALPDGPLLTVPPGYALRREGVDLDLAEFDQLTAQAEGAAGARQPAEASARYADALSLWRGSAFADVDSPLIRAAAAKLEERRLLAAEAKAKADLAVERCDHVVAELSPWLTMHPFRERMRAMLMVALYRLGCRADALALYREGHQLMVAELGLEPGPQLRDLHQHILADDPALLVTADGQEPGPRTPIPAVPGPRRYFQPLTATYVSTLTTRARLARTRPHAGAATSGTPCPGIRFPMVLCMVTT